MKRSRKIKMIVCSKFVFLHLHKSGGTFINKMISTCVPYAQQIGYHFPYSKLPASYRRLPIIGTVRNPWAYYVSWYAFQMKMKQPNALFMAISKNNTLDFEGTIFNLLNISSDEELFSNVSSLLPQNFQNKGLNLTKQCIKPIQNTGIGFYSFLFNRLYENSADPTVIKMEQLRSGFSEVMSKLRVEPQQKIQNFLDKSPVMNTSEHRAYQGYYSKELNNRIADVDSAVIDNYKYSFN